MSAKPLEPLLNKHGFDISRCPDCDRPFMHEVDGTGLHDVWCASGKCACPLSNEGDSGRDLEVVCARFCRSIENWLEDLAV